MSEPKFKRGDKVLVNRNVVGEIEFYAEDSNIVRVVDRVGGGFNTTTYHITQVDLQPLPEAYEGAHVDAGNPPVDGVADEVTTQVPPPTAGGAVDLDRLQAASARTPKAEPTDE